MEEGRLRLVKEAQALRDALQRLQGKLGIEGEHAILQEVPEAPQLHQLHHQAAAARSARGGAHDAEHGGDARVADPRQPPHPLAQLAP